MQTAATGYDLVLDPAAYAGIELLQEDGIPMDSFWHALCMDLLISTVAYFFRDRPDCFVGGNNFIYFNPDQARNLDYRGPDFFFIKDGVDRKRKRRYWAIWEENGRCPDTIVELMSPTTEKVDRTTKFTIYEQTLRTPEYFVYDPDTEHLEGWRLIGSQYAPLQANDRGWLWSEGLGLWLGTWVGEYRTLQATWLRMYTPDGVLVPVPEEAERQRAEKQKQRAKQQKQRAERQKQRAKQQEQRAEQAEQRANKQTQRAKKEAQRAKQAEQRAEQAEQEVAQLRALLQQQPPKTNGAGA